MLGVVYVAVVAKLAPPVLALYQLYVPLHPLAVRVTVPVPHLLAPVVVGAVGIVFTTTFAVAVAVQPALLVTVTV